MDPRAGKLGQRALAVVAAIFGVATIVAGARVLLGADPGYEVFRPLLVFNTVMGAAYFAAGALAWTDSRRGMIAAALVLLLNALVFAWIIWLRGAGAPVARESVGAMLFRTLVWVVLLVGLAIVVRRQGPRGEVFTVPR